MNGKRVPLKVLSALFDLGLSDGQVSRLREIADREWDGDLRALCAYVLTDYVPADELEPGEDEA